MDEKLPCVDQVESALIVELEKKVRAMFEFTGWEDGVDDDARMAVLRVQSLLNDIASIRKISQSFSASE
jgi:hypothetical protein